MKKWIKSTLAIFLVGSILVSTQTFFVMAVENVLTATQMPVFAGMEIGSAIPQSYTTTDGATGYWGINGSAVASQLDIKTVESLTGVSPYPMVSIDTIGKTSADRVSCWNAVSNLYFNFGTATNNSPQDLNATGMMWYVKMAGDTSLFMYSDTSSGQLFITSGANYKVLAKGTTIWTTRQAAGNQHIDLPTGNFEGWIYIPSASFNNNLSTVTGVLNTMVAFRYVGGNSGAGIIGAPMWATNSILDSNTVKINGSEQVLNIFDGTDTAAPTVTVNPTATAAPTVTGNPTNAITPTIPVVTPTISISGVSTAIQIPTLTTYAEGADIEEYAPVIGTNTTSLITATTAFKRSDFVVKAVHSLTGIYDYPMISMNTTSPDKACTLNSLSNQRFGISQDLLLNNEKYDLTDADAIMWYIKCPEVPANEGLSFRLYTAGGANAYPSIPMGGEYFTLEKGSKTWQRANALTFEGIELKSGFEGWFRLPVASLYFNRDAGQSLENSPLLGNIVWFFRSFGGSYGSAYIGAPLIATNNIMSMDGIIIGNSNKIQNLFTGAEMTMKDLVAPLPVVGQSFIELPQADTVKKLFTPEDVQIGATTVKLDWEALEGADSYKVVIYKNDFIDEGISYSTMQVLNARTNSITINNLLAGLRYTFQVYALRVDGTQIAVYNYVSVFTKDAETVDNSSSSGNFSSEDTTIPGTGESQNIYYILIGLVALALISINIRKYKIGNESHQNKL